MRNIIFNEVSQEEWVQLLRVGKFPHGTYGDLEITQKHLQEFKKNFDDNVRRVDLAIDYFHNSDQDAAGWIKEVELRNDDSELWIKPEWTPKASQKLSDKEVRYISADFSFNYTDKEENKTYGATLFGAGLTNRPHIKNMRAILSEHFDDDKVERVLSALKEQPIKQENKEMNFEEMLKEAGKLSEDQKAQLAEKLGFSAKVNSKMSEDSAKLSEEIETLKSEKQSVERELAFTKMLSEGKVVPAQKEAFMKNDMVAFASASQEINLEEKGSDKEPEVKEDESAQDKAEKELSEIMDKYVAGGMSYAQASAKAISENPKLAEAL